MIRPELSRASTDVGDGGPEALILDCWPFRINHTHFKFPTNHTIERHARKRFCPNYVSRMSCEKCMMSLFSHNSQEQEKICCSCGVCSMFKASNFIHFHCDYSRVSPVSCCLSHTISSTCPISLTLLVCVLLILFPVQHHTCFFYFCPG